ncbi:hypothetical protein HHK36_002402 [Tetracentron sinense]|uniref:Uncharacterized protein n=1 Tax=Tetracentron sinense TaxID=13715 RepID=A0A834ZLZ3_TETSI|nr:hypothetical protein HHK36_002402 [Tetracentron sinense]
MDVQENNCPPRPFEASLNDQRNDMKFNIDEGQQYCQEYQTDRKESEQTYMRYCGGTARSDFTNGNASASATRGMRKKRRIGDPPQMQMLHPNVHMKVFNQDQIEDTVPARTCDLEGPSMITLVTNPKVEQCTSNASIHLTGTAKEGRAGPPVGLVDIGISNAAYFFRVALPGVKKDHGQFSCEIERSGKVHIRGMIMTGERSILRKSRVFVMKTQHFCPPGPFTISFSLPGPVDPRLFSPEFRSDGIFEAVLMKYGISLQPS